MARIRYIKPEAFTDEDLGSLPPVVRWFYTGLWTQADCDGILEDKPRELKLKLIPYDEETGEECLSLLESRRKVIRYEAGAKRYLCIPTLKQHQKFHPGEKPRGFPQPPAQNHSSTTCQPPASNLQRTPQPPADHLPTTPQQVASSIGTGTGTLTGTGIGTSTGTGAAGVFEMPEAEDFEPDAAGCFRETAWGFWGWHNQERLKQSAYNETSPPDWKAFKTWHDAAALEVGASGLQQAFELYLADEDFASRGWPISVFMRDTVWKARASARAPRKAAR